MEDTEYEAAWKEDGPLTDAAAEGKKKADAAARDEFARAFDEGDAELVEEARDNGDIDDEDADKKGETK